MSKMRIIFACMALTFLCGSTANASLVWRAGEGWSDERGADISASSSKDQLELAHKYEDKGDLTSAFKAYKGLLRRWPLSFSAPEAQFKIGKLAEARGDFWGAYKAYQRMLEKYPSSTFFDQAMEREYAIGNLYLAGEPQRLWKIPMGASMEKTIEIYETVIKNAPYGKYAPQAQFKIGLANEKMSKYSDAVKAYNLIIDKYPGNEIVDGAQYQIGYAWMKASSQADYDQSSAEKSIEAFQDFLARYPNSEKAAAAHENIAALMARRTQGSLNIAQFYEKQGNKKGAFIYYNEVLRQSPSSEQARIAKEKVQDLKPVADAPVAVKVTPVASTTTTDVAGALPAEPVKQ
jgi:outer membrane protein assembly factor BamD